MLAQLYDEYVNIFYKQLFYKKRTLFSKVLVKSYLYFLLLRPFGAANPAAEGLQMDQTGIEPVSESQFTVLLLS